MFDWLRKLFRKVDYHKTEWSCFDFEQNKAHLFGFTPLCWKQDRTGKVYLDVRVRGEARVGAIKLTLLNDTAIIHRSSKQARFWQLSMFNGSVPGKDTQHKLLQAALDTARGKGFVLQCLMTTDGKTLE